MPASDTGNAERVAEDESAEDQVQLSATASDHPQDGSGSTAELAWQQKAGDDVAQAGITHVSDGEVAEDIITDTERSIADTARVSSITFIIGEDSEPEVGNWIPPTIKESRLIQK
jgi:hypothetical protein